MANSSAVICRCSRRLYLFQTRCRSSRVILLRNAVASKFVRACIQWLTYEYPKRIITNGKSIKSYYSIIWSVFVLRKFKENSTRATILKFQANIIYNTSEIEFSQEFLEKKVSIFLQNKNNKFFHSQ